MKRSSQNGDGQPADPLQPPTPLVLAEAPEELTCGRLRRLGEGIGKVVYASDRWVVKRERSNTEIVALIALWKVLRKAEGYLPGGLGKRLLQRPSRQIRALRLMMQAVVRVVPRGLWYSTHVGELWRMHRWRDIRGERLAKLHLAGSPTVPARVIFPTTRVKVSGWPGWLTINEATERVECTLWERLSTLARAHRYDEVELWLDRFLDARQQGWQRGVFSVDAHLKNFGVTGDRVVLIDVGGLTNKWEEIESRLVFEEVVAEPHIQLGLGPVLGGCPDVAARFNARWKAIVSREGVLRHWPEQVDRIAS
jgi:hypothetical protein